MKTKNNSILNNESLITIYVAESFTYSDVLKKFNMQVTGGNVRTLKKYIESFGVSTSHFNPKAYLRTKQQVSKRGNEEIFCENAKCGTDAAKRRILRDNLLPYVCVECGIVDKYNNKPITLQLEHKNGNNKDHRLENLEFLCPNCHSQTSTYGAKNKKQYRNEITEAKKTSFIFLNHHLNNIVSGVKANEFTSLDDILKSHKITVTSKKRNFLRKQLRAVNNNIVDIFLDKCEANKKIIYPQLEELLKMLNERSYRQVAKEIGCSDNAIRKHLRRNGLL